MRASSAALLLVLFVAACTDSVARLGGVRVEEEGVAFHVPEDFIEVEQGEIGNLVRAFDAPSDEVTGRVGMAVVPDATSTGAYLATVTRAGTAVAGMEPEIVRDEQVGVDGAVEAHLLEWFYEGPEDADSPTVRVLQVVVLDDDRVVYDVRYEALEDDYDDEIADLLERSVELTG